MRLRNECACDNVLKAAQGWNTRANGSFLRRQTAHMQAMQLTWQGPLKGGSHNPPRLLNALQLSYKKCSMLTVLPVPHKLQHSTTAGLGEIAGILGLLPLGSPSQQTLSAHRRHFSHVSCLHFHTHLMQSMTTKHLEQCLPSFGQISCPKTGIACNSGAAQALMCRVPQQKSRLGHGLNLGTLRLAPV